MWVSAASLAPQEPTATHSPYVVDQMRLDIASTKPLFVQLFLVQSERSSAMLKNVKR